MLTILPYCHKDIDQARELLVWCKELDGHTSHELLLLASSQISQVDLIRMDATGKEVFQNVISIKQKSVNEGPWPKASNAMFRTALDWIKIHGRGHWLWLEADAIPLIPRWLDKLDSSYLSEGKPFFGAVYDQPYRHLNGVMIYPQNIGQFNPFIYGANELPFDLIRPQLNLRYGHITNLIQRMLADPIQNRAMTFPDQQSLKAIRPGTALFHGCRDLTLIQRLREQRGLVKPNGVALLKRNIVSVFKRKEKQTIVMRRTGAIGDSVAALCVADKLVEQGFSVTFQCHPTVQQVLRYAPGIQVADPEGHCDINLDGSYESDAKKNTRHFAEMFIESANRQLATRGIQLKAQNIAPTLKVKEKESRVLLRPFRNHPTPFVGIVPRSGSFAVRTVPDETWKKAAEHIKATCFWLGNHGPAPEGIIDLGYRDIDRVVKAIAGMDMLLTVDTGPAHIGAALRVPMLIVEQASSPSVHLSDQIDWSSIYPDNLSCLNCGKHECPINKSHPPCQDVDPLQIAMAVNRKLRQITHDGVSAVIPVYRPSTQRLNQCLGAVLPQVDEIVVCRDQAGTFPSGAMQHPKIKYHVSRLNDVGFGRKCNYGFRHTNGKYVLSLNDDCFLDPNAVGLMLETMKSDEKCAVVGCLLWYPGRQKIQHGGTERTPGHYGFGHKDHMATIPTIKGVVEMENCTGAAMLIKRKAFYDVLGMSESYFLYYEDNDFQLSLRKAGWKVYYDARAQGLHDEHSSTKLSREMEKVVSQSKAVFEARWADYFTANAGKALGTFDYAK